MTSTNNDRPATREEIKAKLDDINSVIEETKTSSKDFAKFAIGVLVVVGLLLAFRSGRKRALRPKTIVSFTKVK